MAAWVKYGESAPEQVADELDKAVVAQDKRTYREMLSSLFKLFWGKFFQRVELHRRCREAEGRETFTAESFQHMLASQDENRVKRIGAWLGYGRSGMDIAHLYFALAETAELMPRLPMFRRKSCRSTGKPLPPGDTPILRPPSAVSCASAQPVRRNRAVCPGAGHFGRSGAPAGSRRAFQHHPCGAAGQPDHRALPPGADAPPGHGCRSGLFCRCLPRPAALSPPAGGAEGCPSPPEAAALPVSHSLARLAEQSVPCRAVVDAQLRACDFGALCRKKPEPMGGALRQKIIFLTK